MFFWFLNQSELWRKLLLSWFKSREEKLAHYGFLWLMCSTYFESRSRLRKFQKSKSLTALCNRLLSQEVEQKICCNIICFPGDEE